MPTSSFGKEFVISREKFEEIQREEATPVSEILKDFESQAKTGKEAKEYLEKIGKALENEAKK